MSKPTHSSALKRLAMKAFDFYDLQVRVKNPVKTKMLTCFFLFSLGDVTCQRLEHRKRVQAQMPSPVMAIDSAGGASLMLTGGGHIERFRWDLKRTLIQGTGAALFNNPWSQMYLAVVAPRLCLSKYLGTTGAGNVINNMFRGTSHFLLNGWFQIGLFFGSTALIRERSIEAAKKNVEDKFWVTWHLAKYFWPTANFIVYQFAPVHLRQATIDIFAFMYSIVMSFINNNSTSR